MLDKIKSISESVRNKIADAVGSAELNELRVKYLGKNGEITALLKGLKDCPPADKPAMGKHINALREQVENLIAEREKILASLELDRKLKEETIDVTLSKKSQKVGGLHPFLKKSSKETLMKTIS